MSGSQEEVVTRRPRAERPEREVHRDDDAPPPRSVVIEAADDSDVSPEEALAESRRQLQDRDRQLADARRLQQEADRRAQDATRQASTNRQTDRQTVVSTMITSAQSEEASATAAYKAAHESGDVDAAIAATKALATATSRIERLNGELEWLKQQSQQPPADNNAAPSPEAQRWIDEHPAYATDRSYRALANEAHAEALRAGHRRGSQSYVDYIDRLMTEEYGEGHGQTAAAKGAPKPMPRGDSLPPSRRSSPSANNGGYKTATIGRLGKLQYQDRPDGSRGIRMTPDVRETMELGAAVCKMKLDDYINDQILIAQEIEAGGTGDIIYGDGKRHD